MRGSIIDLTSQYPNLQKYAEALIEKVNSKATPREEKEHLELVLKDLRLLARAAKSQDSEHGPQHRAA